MPATNKAKPLFSIIVPAYNVEQYISECIESVLAQDMSDYELIIVDDGSTDRTGEICDNFQKKIAQSINKKNALPVLKVIHRPHMGVSGARNTCVAAASGEYLLFLDGDDYFENNALSVIQKALEPNLDLLRFQAQEVFEDGEVVRHPESGFAITDGTKAFAKISRYHYIENDWLYAYRREFFLNSHFEYAQGCIAEDFGLTPLIIISAGSVKSIPDICYNYRQRHGGIMSTTKPVRFAKDTMTQLKRNLPTVIAIPGSEAAAHYLVSSTLTVAARLSFNEFLEIYREARQLGFLHYIHPTNLRAMPRAILLRYFPKLFYHLYHQ